MAKLAALDPGLWASWLLASRQAEGESHWIRCSQRYPLCGRGDINTYAIFAELNRTTISPNGRVGCITPSGIATDDTTKTFFQSLNKHGSLVSLHDFLNKGFFPAARDAQGNRFCLLTLTGSNTRSEAATFSFRGRTVSDARSPLKTFTLSPGDIDLLNPNTRTCPVFGSKRDAEITKSIYRRVPVLLQEQDEHRAGHNPWDVSFLAMLHMSADSSSFHTHEQCVSDSYQRTGSNFMRRDSIRVPLYEAKMVHHFDHRFGDYALAQITPGKEVRQLPHAPVESLQNPLYEASPRYWVDSKVVSDRLTHRWSFDWLLGWRDICSGVDVRTCIACVIPRVACNDKFSLILPRAELATPRRIACLYANLCSLAFDYTARQKLGGTSLKYFTMRQLPVLPPSTYGKSTPWSLLEDLESWLTPRAIELSYTSHSLHPFARDCGYPGMPFRWLHVRRDTIRAELDACFFHLYGLTRTDTEFIIDGFNVLRSNESRESGEFRTKHMVLDRYDALAAAIASGTPYQSPLDPPPGDPQAAHAAS